MTSYSIRQFILPLITFAALVLAYSIVDVNQSLSWLEDEHIRDVVAVFGIGMMFSILAVLQRFADEHISKRVFFYVLQCLLCAAILWAILFLIPVSYFLEIVLTKR